MSATSPTSPTSPAPVPVPARAPAAHCSHCSTVFTYEERDLFVGELFCPRCASRTEAAERTRTLAQAHKLFPNAKTYTPSPPLGDMRPHARRSSNA